MLLLGEAEERYGEIRLAALGAGRIACALSVGSDAASPARDHKGHPGIPNEDALLAVETGSRTLLAVADAHFGAFASHALLRRLDERLAEVPPSPATLLRALRETAVDAEEAAPTDSATTLVAAVYRRELGAGFGFSFGDSTCMLIGKGIGAQRLNRSTAAFVTPASPRSLAAERAEFFEFEAPPESLLVAFTDGIDACHYRHPETSLGPREFLQLLDEVGPRPEAFARRLAEWALRGLEGHPGGQDNLALVVVAT